MAEPVAKPVAEPDPVAVAKPVAEPDPVAEPVAKPVAKPVAEPVTYVLIFHDVSSLVATCKFSSNKGGSYTCCIIDQQIVNSPICKSTCIFILVLCLEHVTTFPTTVIFIETFNTSNDILCYSQYNSSNITNVDNIITVPHYIRVNRRCEIIHNLSPVQ